MFNYQYENITENEQKPENNMSEVTVDKVTDDRLSETVEDHFANSTTKVNIMNIPILKTRLEG